MPEWVRSLRAVAKIVAVVIALLLVLVGVLGAAEGFSLAWGLLITGSIGVSYFVLLCFGLWLIFVTVDTVRNHSLSLSRKNIVPVVTVSLAALVFLGLVYPGAIGNYFLNRDKGAPTQLPPSFVAVGDRPELQYIPLSWARLTGDPEYYDAGGQDENEWKEVVLLGIVARYSEGEDPDGIPSFSTFIWFPDSKYEREGVFLSGDPVDLPPEGLHEGDIIEVKGTLFRQRDYMGAAYRLFHGWPRYWSPWVLDVSQLTVLDAADLARINSRPGHWSPFDSATASD